MIRARTRRIVWRVIIATSLAVGLFVGVVGLAHTRWGRPLLAYLPGAKVVCPLGYGEPIAKADWDRARLMAQRNERARDAAKSAPTLGFAFGAPKTEIVAWARASNVACEPTRRETALRCTLGATRLATDAPAFDEVTFGFDGSDTLVYLDATTSRSWDEASKAFDESARYLSDRLGAPTHDEGEADQAYLTGGKLRQALKEYRFSNYRAKLTATNMAGRTGDARIRVRALFESLPQG